MIDPHDERISKIATEATRLIDQNASWQGFFRRLFGVGGVVRRLFPTLEERRELEGTLDYRGLLVLLKQRREKHIADEESDATKVMTLRLPRSVLEWLRVEAHEHQTSMNQLVLSKVLVPVSADYVPRPWYALHARPAAEPDGKVDEDLTDTAGDDAGEIGGEL